MKQSPAFVRRDALAALGFGTIAVACTRAETPAPAASESSTITDLVVLPNNQTVHCTGSRVVGLKSDGTVSWELVLPGGDVLAAPVAAAASSMLFVRGRKAIHAATPDGKWVWSKNVDLPASNARGAATPVAMSDSTAVIMTGRDIVRLEANGEQRWRVSLPEGSVNTRLAPAMDGSLIVSTTAGVYGVLADGKIGWRRVLAG